MVRVVEGGEAHAVIAIDDKAPDQTRKAAEKLSRYIQKATGANLSIRKGSEIPAERAGVVMWVGPSPHAKKIEEALNGLNADGFVIAFPDDQTIVLAGVTEWGTEFAVYEFLERYVGVRWLMPGPAGEHIPQRDTLSVPGGVVRREPAFVSRAFSGFRGTAQWEWARHNRLHGRIEFHHNLFNLFPPERYRQTHPEFYPVQKGKRFIPANNATHGWQPCFSAPGIVEEAARNICAYFDKHPEAVSYSLGVNDSGGFCECERCKALRKNQNSLGFKDTSDLYFRWANRVVEEVLKRFPDKWFGCLAFSEVGDPPSTIALHPRIMPFLTYDRMKWLNKDIERKGKDLTERWLKKASQIGWYDYIYGTPYCLPRVYFNKMKEYYAYASAVGVKAVYAEAYPNWGEGPKLYLAAKLLWDPQIDVASVLNEWTVCAVGEEAAPYLASYYQFWETFWTRQAQQGKWFSIGGQYLRYKDPEYLRDVEWIELANCRELLQQAVSKARTPEQEARAKLLLKTFEYYEASAASYKGLVQHSFQRGKSQEYYEGMNRKRYELLEAFQDDPILMHPVRFDRQSNCTQLRW